MEFDKSRCYSALNADELKAGDKVIVADTMMTLKGIVLVNDETRAVELSAINTGDNMYRFKAQGSQYNLAYLVERKENCTNCIHYTEVCLDCLKGKNHRCYKYKSEPKTEKKYRPFRDTDELIKVWDAKIGTPKWGTDGDLTMPLIWVRNKRNKKPWLINEFDKRILDYLFTNCEFLDGSVCGEEE